MGGGAGGAREGFSEREFYRSEFRGRTLAVAVTPPVAESLRTIAPVLTTLASGGARAVVLAEAEALERGLEGPVVAAAHPRLEGEVWRALAKGGPVGVGVAGGPDFAARCRELALRLGIFKLVWLDPGGGLRRADGERESFVHLEPLRALLSAQGRGEVPAARLALWQEVSAMLEAGIPAVNVCSAEGLDDELFSYAGSGTLFTRERYVTVRRLGVDDYDAAWDLIRRGVEEGYLAPRTPEEVDAVLANGFGAFVEGRHLAGIGALLPGGDGCSGEIASLYTLTRFLGEGVGISLLSFALHRARAFGYEAVWACTTSERVGSFFERLGFRPVSPERLPPAKWQRYDPERRRRVRCYTRELVGNGIPPVR